MTSHDRYIQNVSTSETLLGPYIFLDRGVVYSLYVTESWASEAPWIVSKGDPPLDPGALSRLSLSEGYFAP